MHASQIQGCIVEQRVEKKRKITESVLVHNVVTVRTGEVYCHALPQSGYRGCHVTLHYEMYRQLVVT